MLMLFCFLFKDIITRFGDKGNKPIGLYLPKKKLKIALVTTSVFTKKNTILEKNIVNKKCYCKMHKYTCIFNKTGVSKKVTHEKYWQKYPHWNKIFHLESALQSGYDWVLISDHDYWIKDLSTPLEQHINEAHLYGLKNVSVILPRDDMEKNVFSFSNFAMFFKNNAFTSLLVKTWKDIYLGRICPKGAVFESSKEDEYDWSDSDQPAFWIALVLTSEFFTRIKADITCNNDGFFTPNAYYINSYFSKLGYKTGNSGYTDLKNAPKNQQIVWSTVSNDHSRPGLGLQLDWGSWEKLQEHAFGIHIKNINNLPDVMKNELKMCDKHLS